MPQRLSHLLVLGLLAVVLLGGIGVAAQRVTASFDPPAVSAAEPAPTPPLVLSDTPLGPPLTPPAPMVTWVQAFHSTVLWSSERTDATSQANLPQWTTFRQVGPAAGSRLPVEYPGDGQSRLPLRGWVESGDVGPAGPPNPDLELAVGGNVSPATGVTVPRRVVQAWPQGISAQYAVLLDEASGEVLWGRNAHGHVAPASLTKIITSLVALDRTNLTDRVTVRVDSHSAYFADSTLMGLTPGETVSMETLLYGLMLPSGNDAAVAIAQYVAGSESAYVDLMNAKATELGLVDSHFVNAHGLDADGHYSSPYDLVMFARAGMRNPAFARIAGAKQYVADGYTLYNLNRLLSIYPKADGVKIGYTDNAGRAIVASATQDGHRVYAALLRSNNPTPEAQALLEWAFRGFVWP
jgi:hypothetical protein